MPQSVVDFEARRVEAYFSHLTTRLGSAGPVTVVCVAHAVPNTLHFIPAISQIAEVGLLLLKPKSADRPEGKILSEDFTTHPLSRDWADDPHAVAETLKDVGIDGHDLVFVDIGGYFARSIDAIESVIPGRILGVMEGTENGAIDYESSGVPSVPVWTVARSPLKLPEDYLVGSSIVFSIEAILREQSQILQTRSACVIGYGRVGSAVADILRNRGIPTVVFDTSPIATAEAAARGFRVYRQVSAALEVSTLVVCSTGDSRSKALNSGALLHLRSGTVVASVTSSDTVLDEKTLALAYGPPIRVSDTIDRYDEGHDHYFWLINQGNAANFVHGAVIGPAIQLIEGEKLAAIRAIARASGTAPVSPSDRLREVDQEARLLVANVWNDHFLID